AGVWPLTLSADGQYLASGDRDGNVKILENLTAVPRERSALSGHIALINGLAFTPDSRTLASGSEDGTIRLWDVATSRQRLAALPGSFPGEMEWTHEVPDGSILVHGTRDRTLKLWDLVTGQERFSFPDCRQTSWPWLSADGKLLLSTDWKRTV